MEKAFKVINEMYEKGILKDYAIGGGIAVVLYSVPYTTYDMDIFFTHPEKEKIILLTPFYEFLLKKGYKTDKEYIVIGDMPIQFLPATTELEKEAIENSVSVDFKNIKIKIFRVEYLIAIFLKVFRKKDIRKLMILMEQAEINKKYLKDILKRYGLEEKYKEFMEKYYE